MKILPLFALTLLFTSGLLAAPTTETTPTPVPQANHESDDPVDTSSPRATMKSFYSAMQDYKKGLDTKDERLQERIDDAIRCFDLSQLAPVGRRLIALQAAIYLKEIIDRRMVMDYSKLPDTPNNWKSRKGTFVIRKKDGGDQDGEYLITAESVNRLPETFEEYKNQPYVKGGGGGAGYKAPWIERHIPLWTFSRVLGMAYWQWIGVVVMLMLGLVFRGLTRWVFSLCLRLSSRTSMKWNTVFISELTAPLALMATTIFWMVSIHMLDITFGSARAFFYKSLIILLFLALIWILCRLVHVLHLYLTDYAKRPDNNFDEQLVSLITRTLTILVVVIGALTALQNLGVEVFSVLAGLGIGGLAIAMAAKDTLANFFGSVMIMVDRPFRVGDYIKVGTQEGTVEAIGFRSTKIRTPHNSLVSVTSSELSSAAVDNLGMRKFRRVRAMLGLTYDTTTRQMEEFVEGVKQILANNPKCSSANCYVAFSEFNSSSLDVLVNFFLDVPDLAGELTEKQKIYLEIMKLAERIGVSFAFPSQSLYLEKMPAPKAEK